MPLTGILQSLTPEQRTEFAKEDESLRKAKHDAELAGIQDIPSSSSDKDSSYEDYIPIALVPEMPLMTHDAEAGGSGSAPPSATEAPTAQAPPGS